MSPIYPSICVIALRFAITNLTENSINLVDHSLTSNPGKTSAQRLNMTSEILDAVAASVTRMKQSHEQDLLQKRLTVPALMTVSGWLVTWGAMPLPGRPACMFSTLDNLGNSHECYIPARLQQRYRSP